MQRKKGILLNYTSQVIQILTGIFYMPVMLRILGQNEYGLYQLATSIISYLSVLSLGLNGAYNRFYFRYKKNEDQAGIAKINALFISIFSVIAFVAIVCGIVISINAESILGEKISDSQIETARILLIILVFNLALSFVGSVFDCYLIANEEFVFQKVVNIIQGIGGPFITIPLLLLGYGSVGMVIVTTTLTLLKTLVNGLFCRKKLDFCFDFRGMDISLFKEFGVFSIFIVMSQIVDIINWNVDNYLIGRIMGTVAVAIYGIGSQLNNMYMQLSTAISSVFAPQVNKLVNKGQEGRTDLNELFIKVGRLQFFVLYAVLIEYGIFGREFIEIWAGTEYLKSYAIGMILMLIITISLIQNIGIEILFAKNMHQARSIVYLCMAVVNIIASIPMIYMWGEIGATIGTAISMILGNGIFMNWYYYKKVGMDIAGFWKNIVRIVLAGAPAIAFGLWIHTMIEIDGILSLFASLLVTFCVYAIAMWLLGLNNIEKEVFYGIIKRKKSK